MTRARVKGIEPGREVGQKPHTAQKRAGGGDHRTERLLDRLDGALSLHACWPARSLRGRAPWASQRARGRTQRPLLLVAILRRRRWRSRHLILVPRQASTARSGAAACSPGFEQVFWELR